MYYLIMCYIITNNCYDLSHQLPSSESTSQTVMIIVRDKIGKGDGGRLMQSHRFCPPVLGFPQ